MEIRSKSIVYSIRMTIRPKSILYIITIKVAEHSLHVPYSFY